MPKYLFQGSYTAEGIRGVMKDGATRRRAVVDAFISSLGGKLETFYFAFGSDDVVAIADLPDAATAIGLSATVGASGMVRGRITPLVTVEEAERAFGADSKYQPPGSAR